MNILLAERAVRQQEPTHVLCVRNGVTGHSRSPIQSSKFGGPPFHTEHALCEHTLPLLHV